MTYIENIFMCMVAPLIMAMLCLGKKQRRIFFFCIAGMGMCLLSAYINTFFAHLYVANSLNATTQIAPVVEEIMKLLPLLFYLVVFQPESKQFQIAAVVVGASFATFENVCYLTQNGAEEFLFLLIRGFGTGAMHVVCGAGYGYWIKYVWENRGLRGVCLFGLLCLVITYHAIYNLLVSMGGILQYIAYFIPIFTVICGWVGYLISQRRR
ncbi:MAG: PrsW family glutamic-type intramembrane protease [Anaerostipes sp.]|nr:PrsW family glutamic-type intramembrane protease [Anaerostipes sp.]